MKAMKNVCASPPSNCGSYEQYVRIHCSSETKNSAGIADRNTPAKIDIY